MPKDYFGREIQAGDVIFYAGMSGDRIVGNHAVVRKVNEKIEERQQYMGYAAKPQYVPYLSDESTLTVQRFHNNGFLSKSTIKRLDVVVVLDPLMYTEEMKEALEHGG